MVHRVHTAAVLVNSESGATKATVITKKWQQTIANANKILVALCWCKRPPAVYNMKSYCTDRLTFILLLESDIVPLEVGGVHYVAKRHFNWLAACCDRSLNQAFVTERAHALNVPLCYGISW